MAAWRAISPVIRASAAGLCGSMTRPSMFMAGLSARMWSFSSERETSIAWICEAASSEMPALEPMLRIRVNSPAPSVRRWPGRVEKAMVDRGTNRSPMPSPWVRPAMISGLDDM